MKENRLRNLINQDLPSVSTRLWSTWPFYTEAVGATGNFDYIEFLAEYVPFTQNDLDNITRAAELHNMGTMIKVDLQNRGYVAQKAVAAGFQSIMFSDHSTPEEVRESVALMKSNTPESKGSFGYPNGRYIGGQSHISQMNHAKRVDEVVLCFMIEKGLAMDNIEKICAIPGVDMVQFGPSDYCMSKGWNKDDHVEDYKNAEITMIKTALMHGVKPRCEISTIEEAQYYVDLGVKHFSLGDQLAKLKSFWNVDGGKMRKIAETLK